MAGRARPALGREADMADQEQDIPKEDVGANRGPKEARSARRKANVPVRAVRVKRKHAGASRAGKPRV